MLPLEAAYAADSQVQYFLQLAVQIICANTASPIAIATTQGLSPVLVLSEVLRPRATVPIGAASIKIFYGTS